MLFELVPADVARMGIADERQPFLTRQFVVLPRLMALPRAPVDECPGVPRVVQHPQCPRMVEGAPDHVAFARAVPHPPRKRQALVAEALDRGGGRSGSAKHLEQHPDGVLDLLIRVEYHAPRGVVHQADRHAALQFAAPRLIQDAPNQPGAEDVELRFGHRALQAQ